MVNAISSASAPYATATSVNQGPIPTPTLLPQTDSVKLSAQAQALAMQEQGMQVKTIAANMGVSTQTVDSYLGINSGVSGGGKGNGLSELQSVAAHTKVLGPSGT